MRRTGKGNVTNNPAIHGVVLSGNDVNLIRDALCLMHGDYPIVSERVRSIINGADLSCANCDPDCCDVAICDECSTEFYEDDGETNEAGNFCAACVAEHYRNGAAEAATHVPGAATHFPGKRYEGKS